MALEYMRFVGGRRAPGILQGNRCADADCNPAQSKAEIRDAPQLPKKTDEQSEERRERRALPWRAPRAPSVRSWLL